MPFTRLSYKATFHLAPAAPYNFDASFNKSSHFLSSDNAWKQGLYWITIFWKGRGLGLKFENTGTVDEPQVRLNIYSEEAISRGFMDNLISEIRWSFLLNVINQVPIG